MSILEKIEAAKVLAALKNKPTEVKTKIQEIESQINEKLSKIAAGEIKGKKLGGAVQNLLKLEKIQLELQSEFNLLDKKVRENREVLNLGQQSANNGFDGGNLRHKNFRRENILDRVNLIPDDKVFTVKDACEIMKNANYRSDYQSVYNFLRYVEKLGMIEVKIQGGAGRCNSTYFAKTGSKFTEQQILEAKLAYESQKPGINLVIETVDVNQANPGHPLLINMDKRPYTFDQVKAHLSETMGVRSQAALAKKITELQIGGYLRRFVEREKVLFVKN